MEDAAAENSDASVSMTTELQSKDSSSNSQPSEIGTVTWKSLLWKQNLR